MRRAVGVAAAVLVLSTTTGGPAEAHIKKYNNTVSIFANTFQASGYVTSSRPECYAGRLVTVTSSGTTYGTDTTDSTGFYQVVPGAGFPPGVSVTASIEKYVFKKNGNHKHICKPASSTNQVTM